jgi:hypothetical protein
MLREPVVPSPNDAESALSDDDLDGVVGGNPANACSHGETEFPHEYKHRDGRTLECWGPRR